MAEEKRSGYRSAAWRAWHGEQWPNREGVRQSTGPQIGTRMATWWNGYCRARRRGLYQENRSFRRALPLPQKALGGHPFVGRKLGQSRVEGWRRSAALYPGAVSRWQSILPFGRDQRDPPPHHQEVYVQEISHGKSASISRTDSVDNEGSSGARRTIWLRSCAVRFRSRDVVRRQRLGLQHHVPLLTTASPARRAPRLAAK